MKCKHLIIIVSEKRKKDNDVIQCSKCKKYHLDEKKLRESSHKAMDLIGRAFKNITI